MISFLEKLKKILTKLAAFALVLWYGFCIIGFDIHTCKASDSQFVSTFLKGFTCNEVHPNHHCTHCHECDLAIDNVSHESVSCSCCCSNLYHALELTGSRVNDYDEEHSHLCFCGYCSCVDVVAVSSVPPLYAQSSKYSLQSECNTLTSKEILSIYSIWRI